MLISWMVTLDSSLNWQIISFIICRSRSLWSSFWSWRVCKQAKLSHLGHGPARIHWKDDAAKTSHCLVRFWSRGIIEQGEAVTVNGNLYRAILNEFLFTKIEKGDIGNIWFQKDGATCRPVFEDRIISRRADAPRSSDLTPLDYYLCGAVKDKC